MSEFVAVAKCTDIADPGSLLVEVVAQLIVFIHFHLIVQTNFLIA